MNFNNEIHKNKDISLLDSKTYMFLWIEEVRFTVIKKSKLFFCFYLIVLTVTENSEAISKN